MNVTCKLFERGEGRGGEGWGGAKSANLSVIVAFKYFKQCKLERKSLTKEKTRGSARDAKSYIYKNEYTITCD